MPKSIGPGYPFGTKQLRETQQINDGADVKVADRDRGSGRDCECCQSGIQEFSRNSLLFKSPDRWQAALQHSDALHASTK
jgi:hypothetical protein